MNPTRRDFLVGTVGMAGAAIAAAQQRAHQAAVSTAPVALEYIDAAAARDVSAIAARIVPSDDGPGATEAGAVYFIDRALKTFAADQADAYRDGLADLRRRRLEQFPGSTSFAALDAAQQDQLLRTLDKTGFFLLVRQHTLLAWLGRPEYGGNRGGVGWRAIGFDDRGAFQPPFGYYDAPRS